MDMPAGRPGDWLLVAGDVGERFADIEWALAVLASRYERVVWVPGNHELWSRRADPVGARGVERYKLLVEACQRLGIVTPEDPYPVWEGSAETGPVTIAPLFLCRHNSANKTHCEGVNLMLYAKRLGGLRGCGCGG